MGYTQEQVKAKNKMIETVPSTAGSTPYFNPKTQRFHDPITKRMVKTPAGPQSVMDPEVMKPMQGPTMPDAQTGLVLSSLNSMKDSLKELVTLTKKSLGIEEKEFAADKFDSAREGLEDADLDAGGGTPPPDGESKGGFIEGIKGAFGKLMRPNLGNKAKLLLLAAGLYGLTKFSETIVKTLAPLLEWLDKTITVFKEEGFEMGMKSLKNDFIDKVVNPSLGVLGLEYDKVNGDIDRKSGSFLDVIDPISGSTTLFTSIIDAYNALLTGRYPGKINKETGKLEQGKRILTSPIFDFLYDGKGMGFAQDPILQDTKDAGFWKSLINLTNLKNPDGTSLMPFLDADAEWRKDFFTNQNAWFESFKKNLFGLLDTDYIEKFDDFMKNDFRTFMEGLVPSKETLDNLLIGPDGSTFSERIQKDIDFMMERFGDIAKFFYDEETGAVFGLDIQKMKDMLPSLQDIVDSIVSSLPKFMRPNTIFEKITDTKAEIKEQKRQIFEENDLQTGADNLPIGYGGGMLRTDKIKELEEELKALEESVFGYESNTIDINPGLNNRKNIETFNEMGIKNQDLKNAAAANTGFNMSGMYSSAYNNVAPPVVASNVVAGDTIVGTSNHMHLEKAVNHPLLTFSEAAFIASGGASNN